MIGFDRVRAVSLTLAGGHFQVVRTVLPASLNRLPLGPSDWPGRLLSSRSAPSPCASSSSYLETEGHLQGSRGVAMATREAACVPPNSPAQQVALAVHQGPSQATEHMSTTLLNCHCGRVPHPAVDVFIQATRQSLAMASGKGMTYQGSQGDKRCLKIHYTQHLAQHLWGEDD